MKDLFLRLRSFWNRTNLLRKALLLLDNAPSHPDAMTLRDGDIEVRYSPPNVTSLSQPMDPGVLENTNRDYRFKLLNFILSEENVDVVHQKLKYGGFLKRGTKFSR